MRCPIQTAAEIIGYDIGDKSNFSHANMECDESKCGWWDSETKQCAILVLAKALNKHK